MGRGRSPSAQRRLSALARAESGEDSLWNAYVQRQAPPEQLLQAVALPAQKYGKNVWH
ncbi:hypothetical protein KL86DES1_21833 [uncultured Desulfovibrio sp.]|uniref:Uncharacterized protein n=1 Tax=uncultured Desulfovibrio sp. TaxID=167968 RepID=A0A212L9S0_9BACT|nr:hypothetical protein KL86DES1_21833 [uncultured Desulfovibrio sp.]VZH34734.1 conserved protein of unknown function [Desulfovibrio sp. 86]